MKINVTAEDIRGGYRQSSMSCPIARAIRRSLARPDVFVGPLDARVGFPVRRYTLPDGAREFIRRFDKGGTVEPFTFSLK